jgi:hypothetical protein
MREKDERGSGAFEGGDGVFEESGVEKYKVSRLVVEFESSVLGTDDELASGVAPDVGHCDKALGIVRAVSVRENAEIVHDSETEEGGVGVLLHLFEIGVTGSQVVVVPFVPVAGRHLSEASAEHTTPISGLPLISFRLEYTEKVGDPGL